MVCSSTSKREDLLLVSKYLGLGIISSIVKLLFPDVISWSLDFLVCSEVKMFLHKQGSFFWRNPVILAARLHIILISNAAPVRRRGHDVQSALSSSPRFRESLQSFLFLVILVISTVKSTVVIFDNHRDHPLVKSSQWTLKISNHHKDHRSFQTITVIIEIFKRSQCSLKYSNDHSDHWGIQTVAEIVRIVYDQCDRCSSSVCNLRFLPRFHGKNTAYICDIQ